MTLNIKQHARRFGREKKGIAAVEFAILLPMMVFVLFGSIELLDLLDTNRRLENTSSSLADVVARDTSVSNDEVNGLWAALDMLMFPDEGAPVRMRITSVNIPTATNAVVVWSEVQGGMAPRAANSTVTLPAGMMMAGSSVIMAEAELDYRGPLGILLAGPITIRHTAYRRSRLVDPIPRVS